MNVGGNLARRTRRTLSFAAIVALSLLVGCSPAAQLPIAPLPAAPATLPAMRALGSPGLPGSAPTSRFGVPVLEDAGIYVPATADPDMPRGVLLALHGMGGSGPRIAQRLRECADRTGWILVAPTMTYRDYMDPEQVRLDDQENLPRIKDMVDTLPDRVPGIRLAEGIFIYGFSRGGQSAHRFALFYPERTVAVAALSSGSYTLPRRTTRVSGQDRPLAFPFGVSDLERYAGRPFDAQALAEVPFWVGVGAADTSTAEVPRPWDPYLGRSRVERARSFAAALRGVGATASVNVFAGAGHDETALMRSRACDFFATQTPLHLR